MPAIVESLAQTAPALQLYVGDTWCFDYTYQDDEQGTPRDITDSTLRMDVLLGVDVVLSVPETLDAQHDRTLGQFWFRLQTQSDRSAPEMGSLVVSSQRTTSAAQTTYRMHVVETDASGRITTLGVEYVSATWP